MNLARKKWFGAENPNWRNAGLHTCVGCGTGFKSYNKARKFCGQSCYRKHRVITPELSAAYSAAGKKNLGRRKAGARGCRCKCKVCGIDFIHPTKRTYCTEHQSIARSIGLRTAMQNPKPRRGSVKACAKCGAEFYSAPSSRRIYCSYPCFIESGGAVRAGLEAKKMAQVYGAKKDANHREITDALRKCGVPFIDLSALGYGVPDLLVEVAGRLQLWEIKNKATGYGRRGLNKNQKAWAEKWRGSPVRVITTVSEALSAIGAVR